MLVMYNFFSSVHTIYNSISVTDLCCIFLDLELQQTIPYNTLFLVLINKAFILRATNVPQGNSIGR